jgi:hypothetical protein
MGLSLGFIKSEHFDPGGFRGRYSFESAILLTENQRWEQAVFTSKIAVISQPGRLLSF